MLLTINDKKLKKECLKIIKCIQDVRNEVLLIQCCNIIKNIENNQCINEVIILYTLFNDIQHKLLCPL